MRDLSRASVTLAPAEYTSWGEARSELMIEGKRPLKAQLQAELASATDAEAEGIKAEFDAREKAFEHDLDHVQRDVHMMIECSYSTRRPASPRLAPPSADAPLASSYRFPVQVGRRCLGARVARKERQRCSCG